MNNPAPFTLAPMMQAPQGGSPFMQAMMRARGMFPKQGAMPGVAPPQNAPVNPGAPPPAGGPAYMPGGQGPMAGGPAAPQPGMLSRMWGSLAPGGAKPPAPFGIDPNSGLPITQDVAQGAAAMGPLPQPMMPQGGTNGW